MRILYRILTALILDSGIALTIGNSISYARAELTGGGASLLIQSAGLSTEHMHMAATYERVHAGEDMVIGILLILLGFCMHALLMARDEHSVRIRAVPRTRKKLQSPQWFWMEIRL